MDFVQTMLLTFKVSILTTFLLLLIAIPLGYFLAFSKSKIVPFLETIVSMPLVLPPSVLGFYLLIALLGLFCKYSAIFAIIKNNRLPYMDIQLALKQK